VFTLEIFIHLEAADRNEWKGAPDDRPLTDVGRKQGERIAEELSAQPVDALVSSPALRCRESLEALAAKTGLSIEVVPGFKDTSGYKAPEGWGNADRTGPDPLGGAQSAGSAYAALSELVERFPDRRVVLCSYGDIVPALLAFLSGAYGVDMPAKNNKKGAIFSVQIEGKSVTLATAEPSAGFPQ
jgi:broad specificity phosphatase PhoE